MPPPPPPPKPIKVVCGVGTTGERNKKTGRCECPEGLVMVPGLVIRGKRTDKCVPGIQLYDELQTRLAELARLRQSADAELKAEIDALVGKVNAELVRINAELGDKASLESVGQLLGEVIGLMIRVTKVEKDVEGIKDELKSKSSKVFFGGGGEVAFPSAPSGLTLNLHGTIGVAAKFSTNWGVLALLSAGGANHDSVGTVAQGDFHVGPFYDFGGDGNHQLSIMLAASQQWDPTETDADKRYPSFGIGPEVRYTVRLANLLYLSVFGAVPVGADGGIDVATDKAYFNALSMAPKVGVDLLLGAGSFEL